MKNSLKADPIGMQTVLPALSHKFSLLKLEKKFYIQSTIAKDYQNTLSERCFEYIGTFDTLEQAKFEQKERDFRTIIIPSY